MSTFQASLKRLFAPAAHQDGMYFHWVDLIRGCAALAILVWHYPHLYFDARTGEFEYLRQAQPFYPALQVLYHAGYYAVQLFWLISGFVFATVYAGARTSGREFFVNRFARLYPLHLATLLLVALLQIVSYYLEGVHQIYENNDARHFLLNALFISHWGFQDGDSFNGPIWSVSVEIFIYIVFFFSLRRLFTRGALGPLVMAILFALLVGFDVPGPFWECGVYFFSGCLLYTWLVAFRHRVALNLLLGVGALIASKILFDSDRPFTDDAGRLALYGGAVLCAGTLDVWRRFAFAERFSSFGNLTYSMYLLHVPVQIALILMLDQFSVSRSIAASEWVFLGFFALIIGLSWLCYHYFEVPSRRWVRRIWGSKSAPAVTRAPLPLALDPKLPQKQDMA